jgi:peptidyl-prolyl cis-trans isomerase D
MVVALEKINPAGYRNINAVADMLRMEIAREKTAEKILASMNGVTSFEQAKGVANAVTDTIKHITFGAPAYVSITRASEPALGAVASMSEVNKVSAPIKGNAGVYVMQVINKDKTTEEFETKSEESTLSMMSTRYASTFVNDLFERANVKDDRYLYF